MRPAVRGIAAARELGRRAASLLLSFSMRFFSEVVHRVVALNIVIGVGDINVQ